MLSALWTRLIRANWVWPTWVIFRMFFLFYHTTFVASIGLIGSQVCMAFRILTNRDLSVDDLKHIVASSNGNWPLTTRTPHFSMNQSNLVAKWRDWNQFTEAASVNFDQFCCILTEFRNLPSSADNQPLWNGLLGKAAAVFYSLFSPVSRVLCKNALPCARAAVNTGSVTIPPLACCRPP